LIHILRTCHGTVQRIGRRRAHARAQVPLRGPAPVPQLEAPHVECESGGRADQVGSQSVKAHTHTSILHFSMRTCKVMLAMLRAPLTDPTPFHSTPLHSAPSWRTPPRSTDQSHCGVVMECMSSVLQKLGMSALQRKYSFMLLRWTVMSMCEQDLQLTGWVFGSRGFNFQPKGFFLKTSEGSTQGRSVICLHTNRD
jgi:hypothetical protein